MRRLAAGLLGFLLVAGCGGGGPRAISDRVQEYTWMRADGEFTATTELFAAHGALWAAAAYPAEVVRFDPSTGEVTAEIGLGEQPIAWIDFAAADDAVWLLTDPGTESGVVGLWHVDPTTNEAEQRCEVDYVSGFAFADGALWTFGFPDPDSTGALVRLDPTTCEISGSSREGALHVLAGESAVWGVGGDHTVARLDPATGETTPILPNDEGTVPTAAAVGAGAVWLGLAELGGDGNDFLRVDVDTAMAAQLDVSGRIEAVAVEGDDVWALVDSDAGDLAVVHLDPDSGAELERVPVTSGHDLVVLGGEPWFASGDAVRRVPVIAASG